MTTHRPMQRFARFSAAVAALTLASGATFAGDKTDKSDQKASGEMKQLEIELPNPQFDGTPTGLPPDLKLDKERVKRVDDPSLTRENPNVPSDVKLISRDKPVTASEKWPIIGMPEQVTDGDKAAAPGSFLELGGGKQWVQIDLKKPYAIHAIVIWHYHQKPRVYRDVVVQVSNDKKFKEGVKTVFNNDNDNSLGFGAGEDYEYLENYEGRLIQVDGVTGQYVRLYSNGNTGNKQNHYTEVEVYGKKPASAASAEKQSNQKTAKASEDN